MGNWNAWIRKVSCRHKLPKSFKLEQCSSLNLSIDSKTASSLKYSFHDDQFHFHRAQNNWDKEHFSMSISAWNRQEMMRLLHCTKHHLGANLESTSSPAIDYSLPQLLSSSCCYASPSIRVGNDTLVQAEISDVRQSRRILHFCGGVTINKR